jgi:hypothetical protein
MGDRVAGICTRCGVLKTFGPGHRKANLWGTCVPCMRARQAGSCAALADQRKREHQPAPRTVRDELDAVLADLPDYLLDAVLAFTCGLLESHP